MAGGVLAAGALGYALGNVPAADLASRLATGGEVDLRVAGSGNPGGTNASKLLGRRWGSLVIGADILKGALAGVAGRRLAGDAGGYAASATAVVGHVFPARRGFKGGKGVATSAGAAFASFPAYAPLDALVAASAARLTRGRLEVGMTVTCAAWVLASALWWRRRLPNAWGPRPGPGLVVFTVTSSSAILFRFWSERERAAA